MREAAIVSDSTSELPAELVEELEIRMAPVLLIQDGQTLRDGVDISPLEVYRRMRAGEETFTLATPSAPEFVRAHQDSMQQASGKLSIQTSLKLSNTYGAALAVLVAQLQVEQGDLHTELGRLQVVVEGYEEGRFIRFMRWLHEMHRWPGGEG